MSYYKLWTGPYKIGGKIRGKTIAVSIREDRLRNGESLDKIVKSIKTAMEKRLKAHE